MIRIWREGGSMERAGVVMCVASFVLCFVDVVDFEALPKTLDRLVVSFPLMLAAWVLIFWGQQRRWRKRLALLDESRQRPPPQNSEGET